ncbi:MAG TPA: transglutaminase family protein [Candidatus Hydrogenedentes bacterium]|nr:transglutaminase family protein [Candidatus Hydrogenedentota bacterium]
MANRNDIPHLIDLLDDHSQNVRDHVLRELLAFGPALEVEMRALIDRLPAEKRRLAEWMIASHRQTQVRWESWRAWPELESPTEQLETAFELLAQFQYGWKPPILLRDLLDDLARDFLTTCHTRDALSLSRFLFVTKQLRGNTDDYYSPLNSNLIHVIQNHTGLPISLVCVFILVGGRCGVAVDGCSAPQHFLARARIGGSTLLFDCYNGGRILTDKETKSIRAHMPSHMWRVLAEPARPIEIIRRVLNNLVHAYTLQGDGANAALMRELNAALPTL